METPVYVYSESHDVLTDIICNESPMSIDTLNTDETSQNVIVIQEAFEDAAAWKVHGFNSVNDVEQTWFERSADDVDSTDVVGVTAMFAPDILTDEHPQGNIPVEVASWLVDHELTEVMEPSDDPLGAVEQAGFRYVWQDVVDAEAPAPTDREQLMVDAAAVYYNVGTAIPWYEEEPSV